MATRNPPVNINIVTASPANTAGATNVAPTGGSPAVTTPSSGNAPTGGSATWESGSGASTPTLSGLAPATKAKDTGVFAVTCTGTNFLPTSVAVLAGVAQETTYVSATSVTCQVDSAGRTTGVQTMVVSNGPVSSGTQNFTWT